MGDGNVGGVAWERGRSGLGMREEWQGTGVEWPGNGGGVAWEQGRSGPGTGEGWPGNGGGVAWEWQRSGRERGRSGPGRGEEWPRNGGGGVAWERGYAAARAGSRLQLTRLHVGLSTDMGHMNWWLWLT